MFAPIDDGKEAIPQSPEGVIVCTPPAENMTSPPRIMTGMTSAKRKHSYEELSQETFRNMRRQTMTPVRDATSDIATTVEDVRIVDVVSTPPFSRDGISSEISIVSRRRWIAPGAIDLDELPFFQFRRFMRSPGRFKLFQTPALKLTLQISSMDLKRW